MNENAFPLSPDTLVGALSQLIAQAQQRVARAVNSTMVMLYWQIGKTIQEDIVKSDRAAYGEHIVRNVAKELTDRFGRGYSHANLSRMIDLYNQYPSVEIIATLSQQLSWSHIVEIIKLKDEVKREFYMTMCTHEHWSVRELSGRIDSMLFSFLSLPAKERNQRNLPHTNQRISDGAMLPPRYPSSVSSPAKAGLGSSLHGNIG